ncbi:hypothetical protein ONK27_25655, partial [Salmonella enterica subsp. enterica serovar Virginia]|nr:hypothetical protein [Salmonella enterica subsp. enterica serovar Virginia]
MSQPLLAVNGLMMRFGGLLAVNNVSLELREREIVFRKCMCITDNRIYLPSIAHSMRLRMHILCGIGGCATSRKQNRNCNRRNPAQNISQNR